MANAVRRNRSSVRPPGIDPRPDRLARRAAGVAARTPRYRPGQLALPRHPGPGWCRLVQESVDRQWKAEYKNRTGGGPGP